MIHFMTKQLSIWRKQTSRLLFLLMTVTGLLVMSTQAAAEPEYAPIKPPAVTEMERRLSNLKTQWEEESKLGTPSRHIKAQADRLRKALCEAGDVVNCPEYANIPDAKNVDIDRLAYAVAQAETNNCKVGNSAREHNNCFGIKNGKGFKTFRTQEESYLAFKKLWMTKYGDHFPTLQDAKKYSAGEGVSWLNRVTAAYNSRIAMDGAAAVD